MSKHVFVRRGQVGLKLPTKLTIDAVTGLLEDLKKVLDADDEMAMLPLIESDISITPQIFNEVKSYITNMLAENPFYSDLLECKDPSRIQWAIDNFLSTQT